ncbi:MAG: hypothetical protein AB1489_39565 [Acidobacteriota bacterium]
MKEEKLTTDSQVDIDFDIQEIEQVVAPAISLGSAGSLAGSTSIRRVCRCGPGRDDEQLDRPEE